MEGGDCHRQRNQKSPDQRDDLQIASKLYLEKRFTETSNKEICGILNISPSNLTIYYPQREHVLTEFIKELCDFQRRMIDVPEHENKSSLSTGRQ